MMATRSILPKLGGVPRRPVPAVLPILLPAAVFMLGAVPVIAAATATEPGAIPLREHIETGNRELTTLRERITGQQLQLQDLAQQESATTEKLSVLVDQVGLVKTLLVGLDTREKMLSDQRDTLQIRLDQHRHTYAARQTGLSRRISDLYKHGRLRPLELILTADSFSSLLTRLRFAALMARLDGALVAQTRQQADQIELERKHLQAALAGIWEAREEANGQRSQLELLEAERRATLREIQLQQEDAQANLAELQHSERRVRDLLAVLEARRLDTVPDGGPASAGLATQAGRLSWPVTGRITRTFGRSVHPEFNTVTVSNGITIASDRGTPVYAVASGTVEFTDHLPGIGVCVIVDHGEGYYSLYANLDRVFVHRGDTIGRYEILAELGEGSDDQGPQLYFEFRQGKTPLDPLDWLRPRR